MRNFFLITLNFFVVLATLAQIPAAITIDPPDATAYDELTLIFDPAEACFWDGSLSGLDSIAFHSGVTLENGLQWQYIIDFNATGENGQATTLYPTGDGRFSITYTPFEYYGFPDGTVVTQICAVFNNGTDWSNDGRDFNMFGSDCMDFFIPLSTGSGSSCLPEGITFETQEQIDNFQTDYPGCTEIEGSVTIGVYPSWEDISNLNGLSVITSIGGSLTIGVFYAEVNPLLTSLSGLNNLTSIGGSLKIYNNPQLINISGLGNLNTVGFIQIRGNEILNDVTGLENITSTEGIAIYDNESLLNLSGLDNLSYTETELFVGRNDALTSLTGLNNLDSVGGPVDIWGNPNLTDLNGLENLIKINGFLWISELDGITSLTGLENLTSIGEDLIINTNINLTSLTGLENIAAASINDLSIYNNTSLTNCELENICEYLANPYGSVNIYNNGAGCNSPPELAEACGFTISCLPYGNYHFITQNDIDIFQTVYPDCTELEGNIRVNGLDITGFNGLNQVTSIGNNLEFWSNEILENLVGLEALNTIGGAIIIRGNPSLASLEGLDNVSSLGGSIIIDDNNLLNNLTGLDNMNLVGGDLSIGFEYSSEGNPSLTSLAGLENLTSIAGSLRLCNNDQLVDFTGLDNLSSIGSELIVLRNESLTHFNGLENLTSIEGSLRIGYYYYGENGNPSLISLMGLENVNYLGGDLMITDNTALSYCEVESICTYLNSPGGIIDIYNNAPGCNSQYEVEAACNVVSIDELNRSGYLKIYPNPFYTSTTIEYSINEPVSAQISIYNNLGKQVELITKNHSAGKHQFIFNSENLPAGIYLCILKTDVGIYTIKMTKL